MPLTEVRFFNSGHCGQLSYLAGLPSWRPLRFHAVFVYLRHPQHGAALIDTGYGPAFFEATRWFPARFYRWLTPVTLDPRQHAAAILAAHDLAPAEIRRVFVSHFHGDHIAGLRHFPQATFVHRSAALADLQRLRRRKQVRHGFLAACLPDDFSARGEAIEEAMFGTGAPPWDAFRVYDYWNDGSLLLVDLPGHALGHTGYVLTTGTKRWFYIMDATWSMAMLEQGRTLPWLSRNLQHSYAEYAETQAKLRQLAARGGPTMLACHCPRTQGWVQ